MLSEHANKIIQDVNEVRKKRIDLKCLLQKYHEKPELDFIQKYAETRIAAVGISSYWVFVMAFSISIALTIAIFYFEDEMKASINIYRFVFIIASISYIIALVKFSGNVFKRDIFEEIIIEIEDKNMQNNMQTKPVFISKLDAIISEVDDINQKINALEMNITTKIEDNRKEIMSIKKKRWG
jgi:hypothetical protein